MIHANKSNQPASVAEGEVTPDAPAAEVTSDDLPPREINGPKGPEPTRYGDWEVGGRCSDF